MPDPRRVLCLALLVAACRSPAPPADGPWLPVAAPTTASLRGLAAVDARVVWIGGTDGTLLRTTDGGANWRDVAPPDAAGCDFRDLHAASAHVALAMVAGQPARLYRTEDGGNTWSIVHADPRPAAFFDAIAFAGDDGVLVGDPIDGAFDVWLTRDAGRTWGPVAPASLPKPRRDEVMFAASGTCAAVRVDREGAPHALVVTGGGAARCLLVPFDGSAAHAVALGLPHGAPSRGAFSLAVQGPAVVAVGGDYRDPYGTGVDAVRSLDSGGHWHGAATASGGYRSAVAWIDCASLVAVGSHGAAVSFDLGQHWRPLGGEGFHSVAVGADGSVWACGSEGRVARLELRSLGPARALAAR